jgi:hypothetical protein
MTYTITNVEQPYPDDPWKLRATVSTPEFGAHVVDAPEVEVTDVSMGRHRHVTSVYHTRQEFIDAYHRAVREHQAEEQRQQILASIVGAVEGGPTRWR